MLWSQGGVPGGFGSGAHSVGKLWRASIADLLKESLYWCLASKADVPTNDDWLSDWERSYCEGLRFEKRRTEWRLGRWVAKCALQQGSIRLGWGQVQKREFEIRPEPDGAPVAHFGQRILDVTISISHRLELAVCVLTRQDVAVGADLEHIETRSERFVLDYFTEDEQRLVAFAIDPYERDLLANLLWSAKESVLKAIRTGLRRDTRSIQIELGSPLALEPAWRGLSAEDLDKGETFSGFWRVLPGSFVLTMLSRPATSHPKQLLL